MDQLKSLIEERTSSSSHRVRVEAGARVLGEWLARLVVVSSCPVRTGSRQALESVCAR